MGLIFVVLVVILKVLIGEEPSPFKSALSQVSTRESSFVCARESASVPSSSGLGRVVMEENGF